MYSPPISQVRASLRRTLWLILIGFLSEFVIIEAVFQINEIFKENHFAPTRSVGSMLNRSQMLLAKKVLLEPTLFSCQPHQTRPASSPMYPVYIVVKSRAVSSGEYFQRRTFTRASWGLEAQSLGIPVIYAVSRATDIRVQKLLENEHGNYGDILQFNYTDAHSNIFMKSTGILNWFVDRGCQHRTSYLLVVDDTVLINLPALLKMISNNSFNSNTIYGLGSSGSPNQTYPSFITTASTLYPSRIVFKLVQRIFRIVERKKSIFFSTDNLITGLIVKQLGIHRAALLGAEDCSCTDLFLRVIISECINLRRVYVWSKLVALRSGQNTNEIDQLITKTTFTKYLRNGTSRNPSTCLNKSIFLIPFGYHPRLLSIVLFILIFVFISLYIPKPILIPQSDHQFSEISSKPNYVQLSIPVQ